MGVQSVDGRVAGTELQDAGVTKKTGNKEGISMKC